MSALTYAIPIPIVIGIGMQRKPCPHGKKQIILKSVGIPIDREKTILKKQRHEIFKNIVLGGLCKTLNNMSDFKQRLETEKAELEERLNKLNAFNSSEEANEIDPIQQSISIIQAGAMYTYLECLKEALARL